MKNKLFWLISIAALVCLVFAACGITQVTEVTAHAPVQAVAPATPTPRPTTFKEFDMSAGKVTVKVDGVGVGNGTFFAPDEEEDEENPKSVKERLSEDEMLKVKYVRLSDLAAAMKTTYEYDENYEEYILEWDEDFATLKAEENTFEYAGSVYQLDAVTLPCDNAENLYVPVESLLAPLGFASYYDRNTETKKDTLFLYTDVLSQPVEQGRIVPVIYHWMISPGTGSKYASNYIYCVKPTSFEEELNLFLDDGYTPVWFEDLPYLAEQNIEKPVILVLGEGCKEDYSYGLNLIKKYNIKVTEFIRPDGIDTSDYLSTSQLNDLIKTGLVSIQTHPYYDDTFTTMTPERQQQAVDDAWLFALRATGKQPVAFAYPQGIYNDAARQCAEGKFGYAIRKDGGNWFTTGDDAFDIRCYQVMYDYEVGKVDNFIRTAFGLPAKQQHYE